MSFKICPGEGEGKRRRKGRRKEGEEKKEEGKRKGRDPKGFSGLLRDSPDCATIQAQWAVLAEGLAQEGGLAQLVVAP